MPAMRDWDAYEQDYVDACRFRVETQVAMFREVAQASRDHGDADVVLLEGALESLESEYFNNMVIVLERYFDHRLRALEGRDGGAVQEVRAIVRSLLENGGTLDAEARLASDPAGSVLGLAPGDPIRLTLGQYVRLSDAFFREIESRFPPGGQG
jgi:hypothetical protein